MAKTVDEIKKEMEANSAAWHSAPSGDATTKGTKEWYAAENQRLGAQIGGKYDSASGKWSDSSGKALYTPTSTTSASSGASGGGNSPYTNYQYTIGSDNGKNIAQNLQIGNTYTASDGSVWTKNNDGTVSVNHNGYVTENAYQPTDLGIAGMQQVQAGVPYQLVQDTLDARVNKALTTPGLEQYAYDDTYKLMLQYIENEKKKEYMEGYQSSSQPTYNSSYNSQLDEILNQILNRDDFSYNAQNDPLYQQYANMYQREGDRAMRDTLAEAAAGAGGMNSYAITAAQQANNYYASQLGDKIPELYQLAYEMYLNDKESKVQDLGILQSMDATQYNRYRDTMNDWYNDRSFAYGMYRDDVADSQWQKNFDYKSFVDNRDFAYNSDWDNKTWGASEEKTAKEEVWKYINLGITPDAELVKKAGMTDMDVKLAVEAKKAELEKKAEDEPKLKWTPDDATEDNIINWHGDTWVEVPGLGRLSYQELNEAVEKGTVKEIIDYDAETLTYQKV